MVFTAALKELMFHLRQFSESSFLFFFAFTFNQFQKGCELLEKCNHIKYVILKCSTFAIFLRFTDAIIAKNLIIY